MKTSTEGAAMRQAPIGGQEGDVDLGSNCVAARRLLVCFSGKIGSGKTSISSAVANVMACRWTSFGGYLRAQIAKRGGDPECRRSLQDLGQSRIEENAESFCRDVLAAGSFVPGQDFVLDGLRHVDALPHLASIATPSEVRLIFLDADPEVRSVRIRERSDGARQDFDRATKHAVEADMDNDLPSVADAIVGSSLDVDNAVTECVALIQLWRSEGSSLAAAEKNRGEVAGGGWK